MNSINKIKLLSPEQAIKIAAGEVVERPINIIKEIIENSIDAGATKISIFIEESGKKLIKIVDNGYGMTPDDAKLSVAAHATSKITTVDDLETIMTFGFRGEALASINSVSKLTITTKIDTAQTGTRISWVFGKLHEESLQSHATGTTLEITNLFDNIPARKKFLKKDETESRAILTLFQAFCLDYQNIHFQFYNDNKLQLNCPAVTQLADRATQLFDSNLQAKILNLTNLTNKLCSITGIISTPSYYRYDRNQIFIFVNNRWVKNIDLTKAIMRGYAGTLPPQKYPAAILFIKIAPDQVDVNIHPKKEEVKFLHPKKIETIIVNSIKATLEELVTQQLTSVHYQRAQHEHSIFTHNKQNSSTIPNIVDEKIASNYDQSIAQAQTNTPFSFLQPNYNRAHTQSLVPTSAIVSNSTIQLNENREHKNELFVPMPSVAQHAFQNSSIQADISGTPAPREHEQSQLLENEPKEISIIGQHKRTYILFEKESNLVFVDQHAAHERILYEQFKTNFQNIATIQLIFPEFIKLQAQDIITITPHLDLLKAHGIGAEIFSDTQLIVTATPIHLKNQLLQEIMQQIIGWITHSNETDLDRMSNLLNEKIHTKMACSAAIKAGDVLNIEQMQQLLQDLMKIENRFSCPHGRPSFWILSIDYLEKQFKRDYSKKAEQFYDFL